MKKESVKGSIICTQKLKAKEQKVGDITYIERRTRIPDGTTVKFMSNFFYVSTQKEEETNMEELFGSIKTLKELTPTLAREHIPYPVLDDKTVNETRKILKYLFRGTNTEISMYTMNRTSKKTIYLEQFKQNIITHRPRKLLLTGDFNAKSVR